MLRPMIPRSFDQRPSAELRVDHTRRAHLSRSMADLPPSLVLQAQVPHRLRVLMYSFQCCGYSLVL